MQTTIEYLEDTKAKLSVTAEPAELTKTKEHVLKELAAKRGSSIPGFRQGKAPLAMLEKALDPALVQSEFLEHAINNLYIEAATEQRLRTVSQPNVQIKKFVPYDTLEFEAEVEVIGKIKLSDYQNIKVEKQKPAVAAKEVTDVLKQLQERDAEKKEVKRAAKDGDEVIIDFKGVDAKTKDAIAGADGTDYPLTIGSNAFIPGFEPELIGMKAGDEKSFDITFPKDYGVKDLQSKKVTFAVTAKKVNEVVLPKLDDAFAAKIGPFKSLTELKADIKKQLTTERETEAERAYENELVTKIAEKSKVAIPKNVIDQQLDSMEEEERRNLVYRGQTWQEHLKAEGVTAEEHRERNREQAELRVKIGLILAEIAEFENITVEQEELDLQLQMLKGQYSDPKMQAELDKPENQRDLMSRILTQKTVSKLKELNS